MLRVRLTTSKYNLIVLRITALASLGAWSRGAPFPLKNEF